MGNDAGKDKMTRKQLNDYKKQSQGNCKKFIINRDGHTCLDLDRELQNCCVVCRARKILNEYQNSRRY